jgi:histone H2B
MAKGIAKRGKSAEKGYGTFLNRIFRQIQPSKQAGGAGIAVSAKAMELVDGLICDLEARVTDRAFKLAKLNKKSTLSAPHVQTATKLVFPPEMGGFAISEGAKAFTKFTK